MFFFFSSFFFTFLLFHRLRLSCSSSSFFLWFWVSFDILISYFFLGGGGLVFFFLWTRRRAKNMRECLGHFNSLARITVLGQKTPFDTSIRHFRLNARLFPVEIQCNKLTINVCFEYYSLNTRGELRNQLNRGICGVRSVVIEFKNWCCVCGRSWRWGHRPGAGS